jgi:hypothetical protein
LTLEDLIEQLRRFAGGAIDRPALERSFTPLLIADPLDVTKGDDDPWRTASDDSRLLWRLVYMFETGGADDAAERTLAGRIVRCLDSTGDSALTHLLLPLVADQERFNSIVEKHARGIISRTGFLCVIDESGYPPHVKLWLRHAGAEALKGLCALLDRGAYRSAAIALERSPV